MENLIKKPSTTLETPLPLTHVPTTPVYRPLYVVKRDGRHQDISSVKITERIETLANKIYPPLKNVVPSEITKRVERGLYFGISTVEIDELAAQTSAYLSTDDFEYSLLASRISVSNLQKSAPETFSECVKKSQSFVNPKTRLHQPFYSNEVFKIIMKEPMKYDSLIKSERDYYFDYFGFKVLERNYLHRLGGCIVETPQYMHLRVAIGVHMEDFKLVKKMYEHTTEGLYTHATPTLFNGGTIIPQMSSCYLSDMIDDSIDGIYDTLKRCALISKYAGGIGLSINRVRAAGQPIRGTNGTSNGLVPMAKVFNDTARYVDQGGGKRKGSFACYLEPWHKDIYDFLELKKNNGKDENRSRDLFYALWIPDLFMRRVAEGGKWMLTSPDVAKGLNDTNGEEFERLYTMYEKDEGLLPKKIVDARSLWYVILESQMETGTPYIMFKDCCNRRSNQQSLGNIRCSNLCCEIVQYTSKDEVAVCNLASLALAKFVKQPEGSIPKENIYFDHHFLHGICYEVTINLNKIIDNNFYPVPEAKTSNLKHRPIGVGAQALADVFAIMKLSWEDPESRKLNCEIFETMYHGCLCASIDLARLHGPYESYQGSPASKGLLQFDLAKMEMIEKRKRAVALYEKMSKQESYDEKVLKDLEVEIKIYEEDLKNFDSKFSGRWDWKELKARMAKYGLRNSLLIAPMPTASTSQILGNNECIEPYTSNIYSRRVLAGEFTVNNKHMVKDLQSLGLWNEDMKNRIIAANGSIQNIKGIPDKIKGIYKTVWELSMKTLIDMAADRGLFVCQSQSFNVFMAEPNLQKLTSMYFYGWRKGLKTGCYYLRTKPAAEAIKFTIPEEVTKMVMPVERVNEGENENVDTKEEVDFYSEGASCPIGCDSCGA
jgi:ribonucleoside-diphosphate reductase alpha subunit